MRVGVIGCGFQGRLHVEMLQGLDGVDVVAVVDTALGRAEEVAQTFGVPAVHTDYRAMLERETFDLVTVCTMPALHREMTVAAFERGAHVLCEKPLAMNADEGADMVEAARRADRMLAVGFNMRFTPNARAIRSLFADGTLGRPVYTRAWGRASQIPWWGEHYRRDVSGGGALAATAVHFLDLALHLADFPEPLTASATSARLFPRKRGITAPDLDAAARYSVEDVISAHLRFAGGFWMTLEGSWVDEQPSHDGTPSWDYSLDAVAERGQAWLDPLAVRGEDDRGRIVDLLPADARSDVSFPPSVRHLLIDVVDAIRDGRPPAVTGEQALVVQSVVDAVYRSASLGVEVEVQLPQCLRRDGRYDIGGVSTTR